MTTTGRDRLEALRAPRLTRVVDNPSRTSPRARQASPIRPAIICLINAHCVLDFTA
jgi:hypothetical protein